MTQISDAKILILATDGFEQSELEFPRDTLRDAGAEVHLATPTGADITGWQDSDWGDSAEADHSFGDVDPGAYDALVLPGGQINPDNLRTDDDAIALIRSFARQGKPTAAICHAPWLLIEAGLVKGRRATSFPSIRTDMENAGAVWSDRNVVIDQGIITSRSPADLDLFVAAIVGEIENGAYAHAA